MHFGRLSILATILAASFMVNAKAESVHFSSQDFTVTCTGWKTVLDAPAKIPLVGCSVPGKSIRGDGWVCKGVGKDGIECRNSDRNGFFLSRKKQVLLKR